MAPTTSKSLLKITGQPHTAGLPSVQGTGGWLWEESVEFKPGSITFSTFPFFFVGCAKECPSSAVSGWPASSC